MKEEEKEEGKEGRKKGGEERGREGSNAHNKLAMEEAHFKPFSPSLSNRALGAGRAC